jgi:hypothetical protein
VLGEDSGIASNGIWGECAGVLIGWSRSNQEA